MSEKDEVTVAEYLSNKNVEEEIKKQQRELKNKMINEQSFVNSKWMKKNCNFSLDRTNNMWYNKYTKRKGVGINEICSRSTCTE